MEYSFDPPLRIFTLRTPDRLRLPRELAAAGAAASGGGGVARVVFKKLKNVCCLFHDITSLWTEERPGHKRLVT